MGEESASAVTLKLSIEYRLHSSYLFQTPLPTIYLILNFHLCIYLHTLIDSDTFKHSWAVSAKQNLKKCSRGYKTLFIMFGWKIWMGKFPNRL